MRELGGYFELETTPGEEYHKNAIKLNSARSCLRYIVRSYGLKKIILPRYTCPVVWESVAHENCDVEFYDIDENFYPKSNFDAQAFVVYTNYFGICGRQINALSAQYKNLIVDHSQSFFSHNEGILSFYSPRKFFGMPDGGYLYCERQLPCNFAIDTSFQRFSHLVGRVDLGAQAFYDEFCINDSSVENDDILLMSNLTSKILEGIDCTRAKRIRRENFQFLHGCLKEKNNLKIELMVDEVPMCYPLLIEDDTLKRYLIDHKIYIPTYWKGQKDLGFGKRLEDYLVALPIDQRYNISDMEYILEVMNGK